MTEGELELLRTECRCLGRYLLGRVPDAPAVEAYVRAHEHDPRLVERQAGALSDRDLALLRLARRGPGRARVADSFSRVFAPTTFLRAKLVTLLAILEVQSPTDAEVDTPEGGGAVGFLVRCAWMCAAFALRVVLAAPLLLLERLRPSADGGRG